MVYFFFITMIDILEMIATNILGLLLQMNKFYLSSLLLSLKVVWNQPYTRLRNSYFLILMKKNSATCTHTRKDPR